MKNNKIKMQPFDNLETDVENARKAVDRKLNYLSESNHVTSAPRNVPSRLNQGGSGEGASGGSHHHQRRKHLNKRGTTLSKLNKDDGTNIQRQKAAAIHKFLQSPRRNGLTSRGILDEDEEEDGRSMGGAMHDGFDEDQDQELRQQQGNRRSLLSVKHMNRPTYSCSSCGAIFHIKSLLGAHRRTHDDDFKVRFRGRRVRGSSNTVMTTAAGGGGGGGGAAAGKQCKYCDRIFDLERALRIHQMCHCSKITPQQRRKLGYTDLAHEKKNAPLPTFQRLHKGQGLMMHHQSVPDPNMPSVKLGPAAIKMIDQEQQLKVKRRSTKYTVRVAGPLGRWR